MQEFITIKMLLIRTNELRSSRQIRCTRTWVECMMQWYATVVSELLLLTRMQVLDADIAITKEVERLRQGLAIWRGYGSYRASTLLPPSG